MKTCYIFLASDVGVPSKRKAFFECLKRLRQFHTSKTGIEGCLLQEKRTQLLRVIGSCASQGASQIFFVTLLKDASFKIISKTAQWLADARMQYPDMDFHFAPHPSFLHGEKKA